MPWIVLTLNATVEKELAALPSDMRARFQQIAGLIREFGLSAMREPLVRHLRGSLWEIRMRGRDGISRSLRHGLATAGRGRSGVCQEDAEDAGAGD